MVGAVAALCGMSTVALQTQRGGIQPALRIESARQVQATDSLRKLPQDELPFLVVELIHEDVPAAWAPF